VTGGAWGDRGERRIIRPQRRWRQAFLAKKEAYTKPSRVLTWHTLITHVLFLLQDPPVMSKAGTRDGAHTCDGLAVGVPW